MPMVYWHLGLVLKRKTGHLKGISLCSAFHLEMVNLIDVVLLLLLWLSSGDASKWIVMDGLIIE